MAVFGVPHVEVSWCIAMETKYRAPALWYNFIKASDPIFALKQWIKSLKPNQKDAILIQVVSISWRQIGERPRVVLYIHPSGKPIAILCHTVWPPMGPNSKLGVAEPVGQSYCCASDSHVGSKGRFSEEPAGRNRGSHCQIKKTAKNNPDEDAHLHDSLL